MIPLKRVLELAAEAVSEDISFDETYPYYRDMDIIKFAELIQQEVNKTNATK